MQNSKVNSKINWKKMLAGAVLGAVTIAPVFASSMAQAAPPSHAPAWGYRDVRDDDDDDDDYDNRNNRDDRYYRSDDRRNRDWDRDDDDDRRGEARTIEGIVTNDRQGRDFVLRLDNGRTVRVRSRETEPRRLSDGDRVRVSGTFRRLENRDNSNNTRYNDSLVFRADSVQIIRNRNTNNNNNTNSGRRTLYGIVSDVRSNQRLTVRIDGRTFNVLANNRFSNDIDEGDRVRIYGDVRGNDITNASVVIDNNGRNNGGYNNSNNGGYNGQNNSQVNFPATVLSTDEGNRTARVRADNGREYVIRANQDELDNLRRGERVRIRGQVRNGVIYAENIDEI